MQHSKFYLQRYLITDFPLKGGRLGIATETDNAAFGDDRECMCIFRDRTIEKVSDYRDLAGRVQISSPKAAISYMRLFSSPVTFHLRENSFPSGKDTVEVEVSAREKLTLSSVFGDSNSLDFFQHKGTYTGIFDKETLRKLQSKQKSHGPRDGYAGIVDEKTLRHFGLRTATCQQEANRFQIRRTILKEINRTVFSLYERDEWVTMDGRVTMREAKLPQIQRSAIYWYLPRED